MSNGGPRHVFVYSYNPSLRNATVTYHPEDDWSYITESERLEERINHNAIFSLDYVRKKDERSFWIHYACKMNTCGQVNVVNCVMIEKTC